MTEEAVPLERLPFHVLRTTLKEKGIKFKTTDKKADLIKMIESGETAHTPKEVVRAPHLEDSKSAVSIPVVPKEIRGELEALSERGLTWVVDEDDGCITFTWNMTTCANLDQSASNILRTARAAAGGTRPVQKGRATGAPVEW